MFYTSLRVTETVFAFALVVVLVIILKRRNIVSKDDTQKFSRLLTRAILPAVIILQLSLNPVHDKQFLLVLIMFVSGLLSMLLTWIIGKIIRLKSETLGMLMITSTFGSSALIGYPLIQFAFPGNTAAMTDSRKLPWVG